MFSGCFLGISIRQTDRRLDRYFWLWLRRSHVHLSILWVVSTGEASCPSVLQPCHQPSIHLQTLCSPATVYNISISPPIPSFFFHLGGKMSDIIQGTALWIWLSNCTHARVTHSVTSPCLWCPEMPPALFSLPLSGGGCWVQHIWKFHSLGTHSLNSPPKWSHP